MLLVGERTNANGSKKFREAMLREEWDTCVAMARDQIREGAHILDVCVDYTGADGVVGHGRAHGAARDPVLGAAHGRHDRGARSRAAALTWIGGRALLNSVNLEEGDATRARASTRSSRSRASSARRSSPPASTRRARRAPRSGRCAPRARIVEPRRRALRAARPRTSSSTRSCCRCRRGSRSRAATASRRSRRSGGSTTELPGVHTIVGLSNVSFGLAPAARQALNSVFLHECAEAGLDAAIVHASKILPLAQDRRAARVRRASTSSTTAAATATTRSRSLLELFEGVSSLGADASTTSRGSPLNERLVAAHHRREPQRAARGPRRGARRRAARRSRSSTTTCSRGCGSSATCSRPARCSSPSCCRAPRR